MALKKIWSLNRSSDEGEVTIVRSQNEEVVEVEDCAGIEADSLEKYQGTLKEKLLKAVDRSDAFGTKSCGKV